MKNLAFIDGQNLHLGTKQDNWKINFAKFRVYLKDKYKVKNAYYFIGYKTDLYLDMYGSLENAGFILLFKEHNKDVVTMKKGNVDIDIVFEIMKHLIENSEFRKVVLVSGDGDYRKIVDYLISKDRFEKILFPNRKYVSSLYKKLNAKYFDYLDTSTIKERIRLNKEKRPSNN